MTIRWEDPPPDRFRWKRAAAELHENPGRWARVLEPTDKVEATNCCTALKRHGCETTTRKVDERGVAVWARSTVVKQEKTVIPDDDPYINPPAARGSLV